MVTRSTAEVRAPQERSDALRVLVICADETRAVEIASRLRMTDPGLAPDAASLRVGGARARLFRPDVAIIENGRAGGPPWDVVTAVRAAHAETPILLLCDSYTPDAIIDFVRHEIAGCILASARPSHWVEAVRAVEQHRPWYRRTSLLTALRRVVGDAPEAQGDTEPSGALTPREQQILALVRGGLSNKQVARQLGISDQTVKTHLHRVYAKLNRSGRMQLLATDDRLARAAGLTL